MSEKNFCYWLQGFFEMTEADTLSKKQILMIKEHLNLVFTKVTGDDKKQSRENVPVVLGPRSFFGPDDAVCKTPLVRERRYCQPVTPVHSCSLETIGFK